MFDNLFNTKNRNYFNRDERQKSLEAIQAKLEEQNIFATVKDIADKLTNLKNYYGSQKQLTESSKTSGAGTDQMYESNWKYCKFLNFLSDAFTPRKTASNSSADSAYDITSPPSAKSSKKNQRFSGRKY